MPKVKYELVLPDSERRKLIKTVKNGASTAKEILHANILLLLDEGNPKKRNFNEIAEFLQTTTTTVMTVKKAYCENGLDAALSRKKRDTPPIAAKLTGEVEAKIIAMSCGEPPEGFSRWTLRLLADKTVELGIIDSISYVSVGNILKKRNEAAST
jgi:transposase